MLDHYNCETLKKCDLKQEIEWLKKCVEETNSPIVFCHNDFRGSNIMATESNNYNDSENDKIILCDFEYSSYGFRGLDFGTIFAEWGKSWSDFLKPHDFPDDSLIKPFILTYIEESVKIHDKEYSENKLNSVEQILKEVKVFTLVSNLFDVTIILKFDESLDDIPLNKKRSMVWL
jgi:thiamine kinase-like enzyme